MNNSSKLAKSESEKNHMHNWAKNNSPAQDKYLNGPLGPTVFWLLNLPSIGPKLLY